MEQKLAGLATHGWEDYKSSIYNAVSTANSFLSTLYRAGLWLKPSETSVAIAAGMNFCCHYRECSEYAFCHEKTRFKLPPKFHAFVHIIHNLVTVVFGNFSDSLVRQIGKLLPAILQNNDPSVLNVLAQSCQQDEDFVGHLASLSRTSVPAVGHSKCNELYLMNLKW